MTDLEQTSGGAAVSAAPTKRTAFFRGHSSGGAAVSAAPTKQAAFMCSVGALETSAPP